MVKIIDWSSLDPTIQQLHEEGKSPNFIAKELSLSRETVVKRMETSLGIQTKRNGPRLSANFVSHDRIQCSICSEVKHESEYYRIRKNSSYYYSYCKKCVATKEKQRYLAKPVSTTKKLYDVRTSAVRRGIDFNISPEYFDFIMTTQEGKCAYTGVPMDATSGRGLAPDCISIDRFDPCLGYVEGNVVLASVRANTIKHNQTPEELQEWMPTWYTSAQEILVQIKANWPTDNYS